LVGVRDGRIQHGGALGAYGNRKPLLQSMAGDQVPQDMAVYGEEKARSARLQPLEQVGSAKADEPPARPIQVVQDLLLLCLGPFLGTCYQVVGQAVSG